MRQVIEHTSTLGVEHQSFSFCVADSNVSTCIINSHSSDAFLHGNAVCESSMIASDVPEAKQVLRVDGDEKVGHLLRLLVIDHDVNECTSRRD